MPEKIYRFLFCLYPSRFREAYGEEALQVFRDLSRQEHGFHARVRLWLDLLTDLAISLPKEYRHAPRLAHETLLFSVMDTGAPRPGALLFGALVTLAAAVAAVPLSHSARHETPFALPQIVMAHPQSRHHMLEQIAQNLEKHYVDPPLAHKMSAALLAHDQAGEYDAVKDNEAFAELINRQLEQISGDANLDVVYSESPLPNNPPQPSPQDLARYRTAVKQQNCMFEKVETLPHKLGYVKLNAFADPDVCRSSAIANMAAINGADAVIFDLRDNTGGSPDMVMLLAAYLFDHPEYMYNPRENTTDRLWTRSPVAGSRLADKPVYVLTSGRTASAAEHFTYNLKMLKRATIVGETTAGEAHSGVFYRIDDHYGMGIPEVRAINPYGKRDWARTGVEPDVKVKAADALAAAEKLAIEKPAR